MYKIQISKYDKARKAWATIPAYIDEGNNPSTQESFALARNYRVKVLLENRPADATNKPIGIMIYGVYPYREALLIQMVHNLKQLEYKVGPQLFAFALFKSLKAGKEGRIELVPNEYSQFYWQSLGFEFKPGSKIEMWLPDKMRKKYVAQVKASDSYKNEFTTEHAEFPGSDIKE